jgi:hypothetical protein
MLVLAVAVGVATLVAVTVRLEKPGSVFGGAVYVPLVSIEPIALELTPDGGVNDHVTEPSVAPLTVAVNCRVPFTRTVTADLGSMVTETAPSATRYPDRSESVATATQIHPRAVMRRFLCFTWTLFVSSAGG